MQVALNQNVDLPAVLGYVREARARGLKAPVLLMGESELSNQKIETHSLKPSHSYQAITTLQEHTASEKLFEMQEKPERTDLSWLTYRPRRPSSSERSVRKKGKLHDRRSQFDLLHNCLMHDFWPGLPPF